MENTIIQLIAKDRIHIPLSSLDAKLKRSKPDLAKVIAKELGETQYDGCRVEAHVAFEDKNRARGMKEAIAEFSEEFPKYGEILKGKISEKRAISEQHLYFGMKENTRLTSEDYMGVMDSLGVSNAAAKNLYPSLMDVSRNLSNKRKETRSILIGKTLKE